MGGWGGGRRAGANRRPSLASHDPLPLPRPQVKLSVLDRLRGCPRGKYVVVAGITPTPLGEVGEGWGVEEGGGAARSASRGASTAVPTAPAGVLAAGSGAESRSDQSASPQHRRMKLIALPTSRT